MDEQRYSARERARALAKESLSQGDALGWFEKLYREADGASSRVPWADREGHPLLREWLAEHGASLRGARALVVGCGLGEDAEELARAGAQVSAFDVAPTAVAWCTRLWPNSSVEYSTANLLAPPPSWRAAFDFVLEIYTLQALPAELREQAARNMAQCVGPGGRLLAISRAREPAEPLGELPWPLVRSEVERFTEFGLRAVRLEDLASAGDPPTRHWRALFQRA
jgi:2-polyprenyl-3-methyl-5-hydroxy-6-metoxy-1,4-benzoquinol methylase